MGEHITWMDILRYGGPWFSALGTTASVLVALGFARRRRVGKPRAQLVRTTRVVVGGANTECIQFRVVNIGEASFTINSLGWRIGFPFFRRYLGQPPYNIGGADSPMPTSLSTGQEAIYSIPLDAEKLWLPIIKTFGKGPKFIWIRSIYGIIYIAGQRPRFVSPPKSLYPSISTIVTLIRTPV
jgi:hypothetical protein